MMLAAGERGRFAACYGHVAIAEGRTATPRPGRRGDLLGIAPGDTLPRHRALMPLREINFDGIIGPSHNYSGLSLGNIASATNKGLVSHPRAAALQGLAKMRHNLRLGLPRACSRRTAARPRLARRARHRCRGGARFAAPRRFLGLGDVGGQRRHRLAGARHGRRPLPPHRRQSAHHGASQPRMARDPGPAPPRLRRRKRRFAVHPPVPATFGDEGAANHMRLCAGHGEPGVEVFVYGLRGGAFPVRQHDEASRAVARLHGLDPERTLFVAQSERRSPPAPSTTTSSPSPTSMSCSPTSRPSRTGRLSTPS
jgi:succinylarginine dihydrolase